MFYVKAACFVLICVILCYTLHELAVTRVYCFSLYRHKWRRRPL